MCEPTERITFCTCKQPVDKKKNHWILKRQNKPFEPVIAMGLMEPLLLNDHVRELWTDRLLFALNKQRPFDFRYEPEPEDYFILKITDQTYLHEIAAEHFPALSVPVGRKLRKLGPVELNFVYRGGKWVHEYYEWTVLGPEYATLRLGKMGGPYELR
jgi:hypothetical protein